MVKQIAVKAIAILAVIYLGVHSLLVSAIELAKPENNTESSGHAGRFYNFDEIGLSVDMLGLFGVFRNVDLVLPSNSGHLPIEVSRVLDIHREQPSLRVPFSMGNWDLEVPRITGFRGVHRSDGVEFTKSAGVDVWSSGYCNNPVYTQKKYSDPKYSLAFWKGLKLDVPGVGSQDLLFATQTIAGVEKVVYPNIKDIDGEKGEVTYRTTMHWKAECIDLPQGARSGFLVTAPNGTTYRFDKFAGPRSKINEDKGWWDALGAYIYVSEVKDVFGNILTYKYESDLNGQLYVSSIRGSDGRLVKFEYEEWDFSSHIFWAPEEKTKLLKYAKIMEGDGETAARQIKYDYSLRAYDIPHCFEQADPNDGAVGIERCVAQDYTKEGLLTSVTLNADESTQYQYRQPNALLERYNEFQPFASGFEDPLDYTCDNWRNSADLPWNCGPTYSTLPAPLILVELARGAKYSISQKDHWGSLDVYGMISSRAAVVNDNESYTWVVSSLEVDAGDGEPAWNYKFERAGLDFWDRPDMYNSEYGIEKPGQKKLKDLYSWSIDSPGNRKDEYYFYRTQRVIDPSKESWEQTQDQLMSMVGGKLKRHVIYEKNVEGVYEVKRNTEYWWEPHELVGDNAAYCWVERCDKPQLYTKKLLKRVVEQDGHLFETNYSDYDFFGNAHRVEESGTHDVTKLYEWEHDLDNWVLNNEKSKTVGGKPIQTMNYYAETGALKDSIKFGIKKEFEYSDDGSLYKLKWVRDGKPHEHIFEDYKLGVARLETKADAAVILREMYITGELAWKEDEAGNRTSFEYDQIGNIQKITPAGAYSQTEFDWYKTDNNQVIETRGNYKKTKYYDKVGRLVKVKDEDTALNGYTRFNHYKFDGMNRQVYFSRPTFEENDPNNGYERAFDSLGRVISVRDTVQDLTATYCYGVECNNGRSENAPQVQLGYVLTDFRGFETIYNFKAFGDPNEIYLSEIIQQVSLEPEEYITTTISTNELGQIESIARNGVERTFEYNDDTLLWKRTDPEAGTVEFKYDEQGNVTRKIFSDGQVDYGIDELNRIRSVSYSDEESPNVVFKYFPNELLEYVDNGHTRTSYTYDGYRKLRSESVYISDLDRTFTFGYRYDYGSASFDQITYPSGNIYSYLPDSFGRPSQISSSGLVEVFASNIIYDEYEHVNSMVFGNGHLYTLERSPVGFPESLSTKYISPITGEEHYSTSFGYALDPSGNVTDITDYLNTSLDKSFNYDGIDQLTYASGVWGEISYFYDGLSNIDYLIQNGVTKSYSYDEQNRLKSVGARSFNYDDRGNITGDGSNEYIFDFDNRLRYAISSNGIMNNVYDSFNSKVITTINGDSKLTIYDDADQLLYVESLSPFGESTEYIHLNGKILAEVICDSDDLDYDNDGVPGCLERRLGFSDTDSRDTLVDLDGDKVSVADEYRIGGDPVRFRDSDSDGLPDDWEKHWGLNQNLASDGGTDTDGDGVTDLQEYELGINPLVAAGAQDFLYQSVITMNAGGLDNISAITEDLDGNIYVSKTEYLSPSSNYRSRITKYDVSNNKVWEKSYDELADSFTELAVGAGGLLYASGRSSGLFRLDAESGDIVDSYALSGDFYVNDMVVTDATVYLVGSFAGPVMFSESNPQIIKTTSPIENGDHFNDAYVLALDARLKYKWLRTFGGEYHDSINAIEASEDGSIVMSGAFWGDVDFNRDGATGSVMASAVKYPNDRFVVRVSEWGEPVWLYTDSQAFGFSQTADSLALSREDGSPLIEDSYGYIGMLSYSGEYLGHHVNVGQYYSDFTSGHNGIVVSVSTVDNSGNKDVAINVVDKFEYSKNFNIGGEGREYADEVYLAQSGVLSVAGTFEGTVDFDPGPLTDIQTADGRAIFIARYANFGINGLIDTDLDGVKDFLDWDDDADGLSDEWELANGFNPRDGATANFDSDNDGLTNIQEYMYETEPWNDDSDGDGISDGEEVIAGTDPTVNIPVLITIITTLILH